MLFVISCSGAHLGCEGSWTSKWNHCMLTMILKFQRQSVDVEFDGGREADGKTERGRQRWEGSTGDKSVLCSVRRAHTGNAFTWGVCAFLRAGPIWRQRIRRLAGLWDHDLIPVRKLNISMPWICIPPVQKCGKLLSRLGSATYISTYLSIAIYTYVILYIYIERERVYVYIHIYIYMYISLYIYIYTHIKLLSRLGSASASLPEAARSLGCPCLYRDIHIHIYVYIYIYMYV